MKPIDNVSFKDWLRDVYEPVSLPNVSEAHREQWRLVFDRFFAFVGDDVTFRQLPLDVCQRYERHLIGLGMGQGLASAYAGLVNDAIDTGCLYLVRNAPEPPKRWVRKVAGFTRAFINRVNRALDGASQRINDWRELCN